MDKKFNDWSKEFEEGWQNSKAYQVFVSSNKGLGKELFPHYIQYKSQEKIARLTKWLVFGTWALAIVTLLVLIFK